MKKLFINWKTSTAGILSVVSGGYRLYLSVAGHTLTEESLLGSVALILAGVGLMFARDYNRSSEQSGVKNIAPAVAAAGPPKTP